MFSETKKKSSLDFAKSRLAYQVKPNVSYVGLALSEFALSLNYTLSSNRHFGVGTFTCDPYCWSRYIANNSFAFFQFFLSIGLLTLVSPYDGSPEKWQNFSG